MPLKEVEFTMEESFKLNKNLVFYHHGCDPFPKTIKLNIFEFIINSEMQ